MRSQTKRTTKKATKKQATKSTKKTAATKSTPVVYMFKPTMTKATAEAIAHTLSSPSKMPCYSYSIPASRCGVGGRLQSVEGSTCSDCYACKNSYVWSTTIDAMEKRFASLSHPLWSEAIANMIPRNATEFRFHDSGDVQSVEHLGNIVKVALLRPTVLFWLPTREYKHVADYLAQYDPFPDNLCVRLSAHMVDGPAPTAYGLPTSTVHTADPAASDNPFRVLNSRASIPANSHVCPAPTQGNNCGDCRACWDKTVSNVSYHKH